MPEWLHALTLLLILLVAAPLASYIPLATLAAVLFVVAYNMGEWNEIGAILQLDFTAISVWLVTFALTVFADLTVAVGVGLTLAALLYIYRVADTTTVSPVTDEYIRDGLPHVLQGRIVPPYVTLLRIHGPFLFGTTEKLVEATVNIEAFEPVVILRLRNMTAIDATGIHAIEKFAMRLHESGQRAASLRRDGAAVQAAERKPRFWIGWAAKTSCRIFRRRWTGRERSMEIDQTL